MKRGFDVNGGSSFVLFFCLVSAWFVCLRDEIPRFEIGPERKESDKEMKGVLSY